MRASRILATRPERATIALADLCQERKVEDLLVAPPRRPYFTPQRDSFFEPAPALSVPLVIRDPRRTDTGAPIIDSPRSNSPSPLLEHPSPSPSTSNDTPATTPLIPPPPPPPPPPSYIQTLPPPPHIASHTHMLPKRSKWTSPPPEDASFDDRVVYESQLDRSLELGTRRSGGYSSTFGSATGEVNKPEEQEEQEEDASLSLLSLREREHRSLGERKLLGQVYVGLEFTRDLIDLFI